MDVGLKMELLRASHPLKHMFVTTGQQARMIPLGRPTKNEVEVGKMA